MPPRTPTSETNIDSRSLKVRFSAQVKDAFRTLAVIANKSDAFDPEMTEILKDWSGSQTPSLHDVMIALPLIAEQVNAHLSSTKDNAAQDAWRDLCMQMPENGFTVSQSRQRLR